MALHSGTCRPRGPTDLAFRPNPPNNIADIVADQKRTVLCDDEHRWPPLRVAVFVQEPGQNVDRLSYRLAFWKGHEDHIIARHGLAVPRAMARNKRAIGQSRTQFTLIAKGKAQGGRMRTQGVIRAAFIFPLFWLRW